jgi:hypothetical protein
MELMGVRDDELCMSMFIMEKVRCGGVWLIEVGFKQMK